MSKIRFNEDWFHFYHSRYYEKIEVDEQYLKDFIYQYKDTHITDFSMNINSRISSFPSNVLESFTDKYLAKTENGIAVDYSDTYAKLVYELFVEKNLDVYKIWIEALREINIKPWLSFRMNDCHGNNLQTSILRSGFDHKHPEYKRVKHRGVDPTLKRVADDTFYFEACFDYAIEEIRKQMYDYIEEALTRYDVDGVELDFTRELPSFEIGFEAKGRKIMTDFIGQINQLVSRFANMRNHQIEISVLVNSDPYKNYEWGLDVCEWAKLGYINSVIALPRWQCVDTDIPVKIWKDLLAPYNVEFAAGNQILTSDDPREYGYTSTLETTIGAACVYRSFGADFTYIYNHMDRFHDGYPLVKRWIDDDDLCAKVLRPDKLETLFKTAGDKELLIYSRRRHYVSFHDFPLYYEKQVSRLPFTCDDSRIFEFVKINVGEIPKDADMYLIIGTKSENALKETDFNIRVNNTPVSFEKVSVLNETTRGWMFKINNAQKIQYSAVAEITTTGLPFEVVHTEILVIPQ